MVVAHENARLAQRLIEATCRKQGIGSPVPRFTPPDRGAPMRSKLVAGSFSTRASTRVTRGLRVSNDNPFSAQFRTFGIGPSFRTGLDRSSTRAVSHDLF